MKRKLVAAFSIGFVTAAILGLLRPIPPPVCRTGDMTLAMDPQWAKGTAQVFGTWIRDVRECRVGDYLVDAPDHEGSPEIMLSRNHAPFLLVSKDTITLLEGKDHRIVYQRNYGTPGAVSYAAYDPSRHAWIDNIDFGADGVLDLRSTEIGGQQVKKEMRVGDRWLEFEVRDKKRLVLLDGKYVPLEDAQEHLAATAGSPR